MDWRVWRAWMIKWKAFPTSTFLSAARQEPIITPVNEKSIWACEVAGLHFKGDHRGPKNSLAKLNRNKWVTTLHKNWIRISQYTNHKRSRNSRLTQIISGAPKMLRNTCRSSQSILKYWEILMGHLRVKKQELCLRRKDTPKFQQKWRKWKTLSTKNRTRPIYRVGNRKKQVK